MYVEGAYMLHLLIIGFYSLFKIRIFAPKLKNLFYEEYSVNTYCCAFCNSNNIGAK